MFRRPEELILAVIGLLWIIFTCFAAFRLTADFATVVQITLTTSVWVFALFILWQRDKICRIWPFFPGLFVACWWPYADWVVKRDLVGPENVAGTIIVNAPWYAGWTFKLSLAALPVILGFLGQFLHRRKTLRTPSF